MTDFQDKTNFIWQIADDILRDVFKRTEYPDIIYPMVLIRRIECVLLSSRKGVEEEIGEKISDLPNATRSRIFNDQVLNRLSYNNSSRWTLRILTDESEHSLKDNFINYLNSYTENIQRIIDASGIRSHINKLTTKGKLFPLLRKFSEINLTPESVDNIIMGYIFEELIRRFSEANNEEAGEHYTPREVIRLMVRLLDIDEDAIKAGQLKTIYDPACGTGGMLTTAKEFIERHVEPRANVRLYGQEVNDKTWAICEADMILKGEQRFKIVEDDTLTDDGFPNRQFDYMISNPPYGKSWKEIKSKALQNSNGRFDAGIPRISDGQMLFTLHMISKVKPEQQGGSAIAVVHNGSPLFTSDAGSGESEIRRFIIENDWLETIVALPTDLFYNTGIATYIWIIRNNKKPERRGKVQLINGITFFAKMKRSLGNKRNYISDKQIDQLVKIYKSFEENEFSKIFDNDDFAYRKVYLNLEERDEKGKPIYESKTVTIAKNKIRQIVKMNHLEDIQRLDKLLDRKNGDGEAFKFELVPDSEFMQTHKTPDIKITIQKTLNNGRFTLKADIKVPKIVKDTEIIPWKDDPEEFLRKEVEKPYKIMNEKKGYEIPFTQHFYVYKPLRSAEEALKEFQQLEQENTKLLQELFG